MNRLVEKTIDEADDSMSRASDAESVSGTVYYGDQAITHLLAGILLKLDEILTEIRKGLRRPVK